MAQILPLILSGGSGTRLWPLSRRMHPKQFMPLNGDTMFGQTLDRTAALPDCAPPVVVCNDGHRFLAAAILQERGFPPGNGSGHSSILLEPVGRNTAPAVALGAFAACGGVCGTDKDPLLLVLSSDHVIAPHSAFVEAILQAVPAAEAGNLVVFGVHPTSPETGFGYIQQGDPIFKGVHKVTRFVEKPDAVQAERLLKTGDFTWNSGMFLFRASVYLKALLAYAPEVYNACAAIWETQERDLDFTRFSQNAFAACPSISIDYAVMERAANVCMTRLNAQWSDMGSWDAFYANADKDNNGNASVGDVVLLNSANCYIHSDHRLVAAAGVENICVVETADAVLVLPRNQSQNVKQLCEELHRRGRKETDSHPRVFRPWGSYETLVLSTRFQVKRIIVNPGGILSLQMHHHRAEHWVVVSGTAHITLDDREFLLKEDESTYIPLGVRHRLHNPGRIPLELIEVQSGSYLDEDDITRFEDSYGRTGVAK